MVENGGQANERGDSRETRERRKRLRGGGNRMKGEEGVAMWKRRAGRKGKENRGGQSASGDGAYAKPMQSDKRDERREGGAGGGDGRGEC